MTFKYRAVTANCGNDSIGIVASDQISDLLTKEDNDFIVINCQEVDFKKTQKQLEERLEGKGYKVGCLGKMVTHTKLSTQLHDNTGITSYIIYKSNLTITDSQVTEVRRNSSRFSRIAYNKGGLVTNFTMEKQIGTTEEKESIRVQAISGHLDSNDTAQRNQDWQRLHQGSAIKTAESWDALVAACPNLKLSGYDANTRNKVDGSEKGYNPWTRPDEHDMQSLHKASMGGRHFSKDITYSKPRDKKPAESTEAHKSKRHGFLDHGMLDMVSISDDQPIIDVINTDDTVLCVSHDKSTARDHDVLISPLQEYKVSSDFDAVKGQMASSVHHFDHDLATKIREMEDSSENRTELISLYNAYLCSEGWLKQSIKLHTEKLHIFKEFSQCAYLKDGALKKEISDTLFKPSEWIITTAEKKELMEAFINSLKHCKHESGIQARLECYRELTKKMDEGKPVPSPAQEFKKQAVSEYFKIRGKLSDTFNEFDAGTDTNRQQFKDWGCVF